RRAPLPRPPLLRRLPRRGSRAIRAAARARLHPADRGLSARTRTETTMTEARTVLKMRKHLRTYLAVSALLALAATGCSDGGAAAAATEKKAEPIAVQVMAAEVLTVPSTLSLDGTLRAKRQARISPRVAGHVERVLVERGDV